MAASGWALSDRPIGRRMTFVGDDGDAALCSVEDLVLLQAAKFGWCVTQGSQGWDGAVQGPASC